MKHLVIEKNVIERSSDFTAYVNTIKKYPRLTDSQQLELLDAAQAGDNDARDMLVNCNMRFVISIARKYDYCKGTLTLTDLINEGAFGLLSAIKTFDATMGFTFGSHAVNHIRKYIMLAITHNSRIVADYHTATPNVHTSLDAPAYDDDDTTLADVYCQHTDKDTDKSLLTDILRSMQAILTERERYIICHIYGIETVAIAKFVLAERLGLTEERIRQISEIAINKLKNDPKVMMLLVKYL